MSVDQERESLQAERDALAAENAKLKKASLEDWVRVAGSEVAVSSLLHNMQSSLSWRITKPLRAVRTVQRKAAKVGYLRALRMSGGYLRRIRGNRGRK
jgi:hypothetical protein